MLFASLFFIPIKDFDTNRRCGGQFPAHLADASTKAEVEDLQAGQVDGVAKGGCVREKVVSHQLEAPGQLLAATWDGMPSKEEVSRKAEVLAQASKQSEVHRA